MRIEASASTTVVTKSENKSEKAKISKMKRFLYLRGCCMMPMQSSSRIFASYLDTIIMSKINHLQITIVSITGLRIVGDYTLQLVVSGRKQVASSKRTLNNNENTFLWNEDCHLLLNTKDKVVWELHHISGL